MAVEFKLPELGGDTESGDVLEVLVAEGDEIAVDQEVIEIETDKAVMPVPSSIAGKVAKVHVAKGDTISVGDVILSFERNGEAPADKNQATADQAEEKPPAKKSKPEDGEGEKEQPEKTETAEKATAKSAVSAKKEDKKQSESEESQDDTARMKEAAEEPDADAADDKQQERVAEDGKKREPDRDSSKDGEPRPARSREKPAPEIPRHVEIAAVGMAPPASPETRRYARELGVDIRQIRGTGSGGRITREDVTSAVRETFTHAALPPAGDMGRREDGKKSTDGSRGTSVSRVPITGEPGRDAWGPVRHAKLTKMRDTIAANMARSAATIPHVTNFDDADITELEKIRKGSMADYVGDVKLTMMAFVLKACAVSLKQHPVINASLDIENKQIIHKEYVHIGVAVDTDRGLVVPVMRDVDKLTIPQIALLLTKLADDARESRYKIEDLRGGTFTISNLGAIGGTYSTPIINYPEVAILLVGRSRKLPVVVDDQVQVRLMMPLSLSYDHRLVDGAAAGRFLNQVKEFLETPGRLLLAP